MKDFLAVCIIWYPLPMTLPLDVKILIYEYIHDWNPELGYW